MARASAALTLLFAVTLILAAAARTHAHGVGVHEYAYAVLDQPAEGNVTGNIELNTYLTDDLELVTTVSGATAARRGPPLHFIRKCGGALLPPANLCIRTAPATDYYLHSRAFG